MPGLVPGIQEGNATVRDGDVDGQAKPGHDEKGMLRRGLRALQIRLPGDGAAEETMDDVAPDAGR